MKLLLNDNEGVQTSAQCGQKPHTVQGRSDKYLASPPEGATSTREICFRVVHSHKRLLSKTQPNRNRSFVLITCGSMRVREFLENKWESLGKVFRTKKRLC